MEPIPVIQPRQPATSAVRDPSSQSSFISSQPFVKRKRNNLDEQEQPNKRLKLCSQFTQISLINDKQKQKILNAIKQLFSWMVHRFDVFKQIRREWPAPPHPPLINGHDDFLRMLILKLTEKNLRLDDCVELYASNGDLIIENMKSKNRKRTNRLLRNARFSELPPFAKVIIQQMNKIICTNQQNETFLRRKLNELWYKFPIKRDYAQLESIIVHNIMSLSLRMKTRPSHVLELEQREFDEICSEGEKYTKCYAQCYMILLCPLCFNGKVMLTHSLNLAINGCDHVNVCKACHRRIASAKSLWEFYESMRGWDNGWDLLLENCKNDKHPYASMLGVMCAVLFRQRL